MPDIQPAGSLHQSHIERLLAQDTEHWYSDWVAFLRNHIELSAVSVLADRSGVGRLEAVALWPGDSPFTDALQEASQQAVDDRAPVISYDEEKTHCIAAWPAYCDGHLLAVVGLALPFVEQQRLSEALKNLEWAAGWLQLTTLRPAFAARGVQLQKQSTILDGFAAVLSQPRFSDAAHQMVNFVARELDCERVVLGFLKQEDVKILCQSDSSFTVDKLDVMKLSQRAMQEAVDQLEALSWPADPEREQVLHAQRELSGSINQANLLSIPLVDAEACYGVMLLQRPLERPFDVEERKRAEALVNVVGRVLEQKRQSQASLPRLLGGALRHQGTRMLAPGYLGRKLTLIIATALVIFFSFFRADYRLGADAILEGAGIRASVVPYDGFLEQAPARAGDEVAAGDLLAALDARELRLERMKWLSEQSQARRQYEEALSKQNRAQVQVYNAQIERARAELALLDYQLEQAELRAPFDAVVVSGELSQRIGSAVRQGDILFELAPRDSYRLSLFVDEFRANDIRIGQEGELLLAALPDEQFPFRVSRIIPVAEVRDGVTVYRVEAELLAAGDLLRPGLEGVGKVSIDERLLISIWTRTIRDWLTLQWWRFWG